VNTPPGYNPMGQSAPGLPRHDAPLPGHVPGQPFPQIGGGEAAPRPGGFNPGYAGPAAIPAGAANWLARGVFFGWLYLTAPIQAALYPLAGIGGLAGAALGYLLARSAGGGYDMTHAWAWSGCFLGVVALMRTETRIELGSPGYRALRWGLRLILVFLAMGYAAIEDEGAPAARAAVVAAAFTIIVYLVLRSKWLRFIWHSLQRASWMRTALEPPPSQR
jgi:hypothetical protein